MNALEILNSITNPTELAKIIGKHKSTASRILSGKQSPTTAEIGDMVNHFKKLKFEMFFPARHYIYHRASEE